MGDGKIDSCGTSVSPMGEFLLRPVGDFASRWVRKGGVYRFSYAAAVHKCAVVGTAVA